MTVKEKVFKALNDANAIGHNIGELDEAIVARELIKQYSYLDGCYSPFLIPFIKEWKARHDEHTREGLD